MKDEKEIDDKTFYEKLDNSFIPSDDEMEEVREFLYSLDFHCRLYYLNWGTDVGYWYVSKCRIRLNIQFYA